MPIISNFPTGTYYPDGDKIKYSKDTPAMDMEVRTDTSNYKSIVASIAKKTGVDIEPMTPAEIAPRIDAIPETSGQPYGRSAPTLSFDKPEISFQAGVAASDTVTVSTNSDGAITVSSKAPEIATAEMTGLNTFKVSAVTSAPAGSKCSVEVEVASGTSHRRMVGTVSVVYL